MSLWTDKDSDDFDHQIRALRAADRRERSGTPRPPNTRAASEDDLRRRKKVERAMEVRAARETNKNARSETYRANRAKRTGRVRGPKPKQKPNGRWHAAVTEAGEFYSKTFDTEVEAQEWLDSITGR